jgi:hypothetical protein
MITRDFVRTSGAGGPAFLICLAGQPCGVPRPCVLCKGGRRFRLGYVICHAAACIALTALTISTITYQNGGKNRGRRRPTSVSSTLHKKDSRTISQKGERSPHFLAFLLSCFPVFCVTSVTSLSP